MKTSVFIFVFLTLMMVTTVTNATVLVNSQSGIVKGNSVNLRAQPGLYSYVITVLQQGSSVTVTDKVDQWYKVQLLNGESGWIYQQYIELNPQGTNQITEPLEEPWVNQLLSYAESFLGVKYVYGGDSPRGFDCSGYTMYVFS